MIVVFGKTIDEIEEVIDLSLVWTFRVERERIKFLKDDDTWTKPNLKDIGTPQEVMKYISYALAQGAKVCPITAETIKTFREDPNEEEKYKKQRRLREAMAQARARALSKEEKKDVDNT